MQGTENHLPASDGWTTSEDYPDVTRRLWDIAQSEKAWVDSSIGSFDVKSPKEVTTRHNLGVDDIRGEWRLRRWRTSLTHRPRKQDNHSHLYDAMHDGSLDPTRVAAQRDIWDTSKGTYHGPVTGHT
jgi:hypothetical protein